MTILAWTVYLVLIICSFFSPGYIAGKQRSPIAGAILAAVVIPIVGTFFIIIGWVGTLLVLPIRSLF